MGLSKGAIELMKENGYRWKTDSGVLTFERSADSKAFIIVLAVFLSIGLIIIGNFVPLFSLLIIILVWWIAYHQIRKRQKSSIFKLDFRKKCFEIDGYRRPIADITNLHLHSVFVDEYTSAHKGTSKEYEISIELVTQKEGFKVLSFRSDNEKPHPEVHEIFERIKTMLKASKNS